MAGCKLRTLLIITIDGIDRRERQEIVNQHDRQSRLKHGQDEIRWNIRASQDHPVDAPFTDETKACRIADNVVGKVANCEMISRLPNRVLNAVHYLAVER